MSEKEVEKRSLQDPEANAADAQPLNLAGPARSFIYMLD